MGGEINANITQIELLSKKTSASPEQSRCLEDGTARAVGMSFEYHTLHNVVRIQHITLASL